MVRKLATLAVALGLSTAGLFAVAVTADATSINCIYSGPVVGHPGMQYICYVIHSDGSRETFYAPGPSARP